MNDVIEIMLIFGYENDEGKLDKYSCQRQFPSNICDQVNDVADFVGQLINIVYEDCLNEEEFTKIVDKINKVTLTIYCKDLSEDVSSDAGIDGDGEEL